MGWICACGTAHTDEQESCKCGYRWEGCSPSGARGYIRCKVCDEGHLTPKRIFRLSGPAVAIGYILLIPSVIGMALCVVLFFDAAAKNMPIGQAVSAVVGVGLLVGGLLGWLLVMRKSVLRCSSCGVVVDASFGTSVVRPVFLVALAVVLLPLAVKFVSEERNPTVAPQRLATVATADTHEDFDTNFRSSCLAAARKTFEQKTGTDAPAGLLERYCDCTLTTFKETRSEATAAQVCAEKIVRRAVEQPPTDEAPLQQDPVIR